MTDSTNNTSTEKENIFENNFAFVTSDGEVKLKKTTLFDERTIAKIDPETAEEKVETFEKAFQSLQIRMGEFLDEAQAKLSTGAEETQKKFDELIDELKDSEAIGDFDELVETAKETFTKMKESAQAKEEKEEQVAEHVPAPSDEPEVNGNDTESTSGNDSEMPGEVKKETAAEDETVEAPAEDSESEEEETAETKETVAESAAEEDDASINYYKSLGDKAAEISDMSDWAYVSMEFDNIDLQWEQGPEAEADEIKAIRKEIDKLREEFEAKKKAHYEEQKRIRLENLEKKKELLASLKEIVDEKKWTHTREVGKIKGRWEHVKPVPADEAEKLQVKFDSLLTTFDEHKVDRLVKQKQQEEDNLTGKLVILEKMDSFVNELDDKSDWPELEKKFNEFTKQFRKIGRVPSEKNQEVWNRYHNAQDTFHSLRFKHDSKYRNQIEKFLSKKKKLIDEAEALIDADDLADAARQVNKLHRRWKKVGNLPQKDENEMWDRFKAATDAFNQKKSDNADLLREQEEQNYGEKLKLIKKAEELKESDDWEKTHKEFQRLMDSWKKVGPVPKKKSGKIWKKFKGAMDSFYDRRRDHFKEIKEERKDNLKEKEEILGQLSELKDHDDPIKAVELAKPLQEEFKKAGYVPIKHKNRLWKEYREICDVIYDRFRAAKAAVDVVGRQNIDQFSADDIAGIRNKQNELNKLRKQTSKLEGELIQMKESLSYFKPTKSGSSLLDDVKKRIANAEKDLADKESRMVYLEQEIDKLKKDV